MSDDLSLANGLRGIYDQLDGFKIKSVVDEIGIKAFIRRCAGYAASSGFAAGLGGPVTLIVGLPVDLLNCAAQEFRVALAVIYDRTGRYRLDFSEFIKIFAVTLGIEVATTTVGLGANMIARAVAARLTLRLSTRAAAKAVPLVGAALGGGINFAFIASYGASLLALEDKIFHDATQ